MRNVWTKIVILGASTQELEELERLSGRARWRLHACGTLEEALGRVEEVQANIFLCAALRDGGSWREALARCRVRRTTPVIVFAPFADEALWLDVVDAGGQDVLRTPFTELEVVYAIHTASGRIGSFRPFRTM